MSTGPTIVVQTIGSPDCQVLFDASSAYLRTLDLPSWQLVEGDLPTDLPDCWLVVGRTEAELPLQDGYLVDLDLHNPDDLRHPIFRRWRQQHPKAIPTAARAATRARVVLCQTATLCKTAESGLKKHEASYGETIARRIGLWIRFWHREAESAQPQAIPPAAAKPLGSTPSTAAPVK